MRKGENRFIITAMLLSIIMIGMTGCFDNNSPSYNEGYGFITVRIHPIAADANTIYISSPEQHTVFTAELTNEMFREARGVKLVPDNYNPLAIDFSKLLSHNFPDMDGYNIDTGYKDYHIMEVNVPVSSIAGRPYTTNLRYHLCAESRTFVETQVCIRPQGQIDNRGGTCTPGTVTLNRGQGAPVAVTSIHQFDSGNAVAFHINVANKGRGLVYSRSDDMCGFISQDSIGRIDLIEVSISGNRINCERTSERLGYTKQYQASSGATFVCSATKSQLEMPSSGGPQSLIFRAEFAYNYHVELPSQNIIIKDAPGFSST
jgi:hypothetical protein